MDVPSLPRHILVTGGAGFIGSHRCDTLLNSGHEALCVDNVYSAPRGNVEHLLGDPRLELMRHDVTFPAYVEIDEIHHLARPASAIHDQRDPVPTTKTGVDGSVTMLGLAKRTKAKILLASTSQVYGDPSGHPQTEDGHRGRVARQVPRCDGWSALSGRVRMRIGRVSTHEECR